MFFTDNSGSWGYGGIFSALGRRSDAPENFYSLAGTMKDLSLGDAHLVPLKEGTGGGDGQGNSGGDDQAKSEDGDGDDGGKEKQEKIKQYVSIQLCTIIHIHFSVAK